MSECLIPVTSDQYLRVIPFLANVNSIIEEKLAINDWDYYYYVKEGWIFKSEVRKFNSKKFHGDVVSEYTRPVRDFNGHPLGNNYVRVTEKGNRLQKLYKCFKHQVDTVYITPELYEEFIKIGAEYE